MNADLVAGLRSVARRVLPESVSDWVRRRFRGLLPPPLPPRQLRGGIGAGEFWAAGRQIVDQLDALGLLRPGLRCLDLGSGLGRVAYLLAPYVGRGGRYAGFDAAEPYVDWSRRALGLDPEHFEFVHLDVRSDSYNPDGTVEAASVELPWPAEHFDLVVATSLFTHLQEEAVARYLSEARRVMCPSARLFATFYLLDDASRPRVEAGETWPRFAHPTASGRLADAAMPDEAVAYDRDVLHRLALTAGLGLELVLPGQWRASEPAILYQDGVLARPL